MTLIDTLSFHMEESIAALCGDFVLKRNSYEEDVVSRFNGNWSVVNSRYYDCVYNNAVFVELKKGQSSMWFDMVRYAEIALGHGLKNTWTMFLLYDKTHKNVKEIYIFPTSALMDTLHMTPELALMCVKMNKNAPRGCNIQFNLSKKDMRDIAIKHGAVIRR